MLQILHVRTGNVIESGLLCQREAEIAAIAFIKRELAESPKGQRVVDRLGGRIMWDFVRTQVVIMEMLGVWITTESGRILPEDTTDDFDLVFITKNGKKHVGMYDAEEGRFVDQTSDDSFPHDKVKAYMVLPDSDDL
jgi:hypothetical protein